MNIGRCVILACELAIIGCLRVHAATMDNPYQAIVQRNVFGLVPIPEAPPPQASKPDAPLPKITPNGIMTIFGKLQVLFKVSEPGKPANQEDSYVMSVGDRQDDIEVQKIDEKSATITFNNHGTIQELALVAGKASTGAPTPAANHGPAGIPLPRPGIPAPSGKSGPTASAIGGHVGLAGKGNNDSPHLGGGAAGAGIAQSGNNLNVTPEEQVIMIEANRLKAIEEGDPVANIMPPTPLTSQTLGQDGGDNGGTPAPPAPGQ